MTTCISLKERFADRFRVTYEESYYADHGDGARAEDPWLMQIECHFGTITPYGDNELIASTFRRGPTATKLAALPCVTPWQDGDDGVSVRFDAKDFKAVAAVMKPRRRRRLTPEHRAKLVAASAAYRFKPASDGSKPSPSERHGEVITNTASQPSDETTPHFSLGDATTAGIQECRVMPGGHR